MSYQHAVLTAFGEPDMIQVMSRDRLPEPGDGEVRIRVEASSATFTDTLVRKGIYPYLRARPPLTPGYDFVGRVDQLGAGVSTFVHGDRVADVTQIGSNSDYVVRPVANLIPVPAAVDAVAAETLLLSGMTAYQMLHRMARVQPGQSILVQGGTGAVGSALVQLGRIHGIRVVTTASANHRDLLRSHGAEVVDYRALDLERQLRHLAGDGFQAVFDGVGLGSFQRSFRLLARGGVLIPYGYAAAGRSVRRLTRIGSLLGKLMFAGSRALFRLWNALPNDRQVLDYDLMSYRREQPQAYLEDIAQTFQLLESGHLQPLIHQTYRLQDIQLAHQALERGGIRGRIVIAHV